MPSTLTSWLKHIEQLHPHKVDLSLDRVRTVAQRLAIRFSCPVFTVGGTNGKGSTCAMLAAILRAAGYRVGLHTSPHLLRFNERALIDQVEASDEQLAEQFAAVEAARADVSLTYFEFSLLAILRLFMQAQLDVVILEVGLGGRLDAVNIIDADCSIITSIDLDHTDYLGPTREHIGFEKAHIYRGGRPAICSDPAPPQSLLEVATRLGADLWCFGRDFNYQSISDDRGARQWSYGGRSIRRASLPYPALRGANQLLNACGVLAALEALANRLPVSQQAVRQGLLTVELAARFQVLPGQPTVILDVAHNPHAAAVLAQNLDSQGFFPTTFAVLGMLRDKDVMGVVSKLGSRIDQWFIGPTEGTRGLEAEQLRTLLVQAKITAPIATYPSVKDAFEAAHQQAQADARIVAFGSFLTVAEVMQARETSNLVSR